MIERPILFSAPMMRALLDGTKTQTRRAFSDRMIKTMGYAADAGEVSRFIEQARMEANDESYVLDFCPYGQPGDRLWVREAWAQRGAWRIPAWPEADADDAYWAGTEEVIYTADVEKPATGWRGRPSIHMPRAASRILLEIVSVRVERLNDCSEADAKAEGVMQLDDDNARPEVRTKAGWQLCPTCAGTGLRSTLGAGGGVNFDVDCVDCDTHLKLYRHLWESINGVGSWAANPWVWRVEFRRVTP